MEYRTKITILNHLLLVVFPIERAQELEGLRFDVSAAEELIFGRVEKKRAQFLGGLDDGNTT